MKLSPTILICGATVLFFLSAVKSIGGKELPSAIYFAVGVALGTLGFSVRCGRDDK